MEKLDALCCVGSLISLTSKSEIRYEGELFTLDTEKSTIVLKDVRSFGTEGRGTNNLQIPSSSTVYEYIIFRNTDIKDLSVVAFPGISNGTIKDVQEVVCLSERSHDDHLSNNSLDICLGWPVSPHSLLQIQAVPNWWQWPCPVASLGSYGISPNCLLASLPAAEKRRANTCFWREQQDASVSSFQEKLSIFEQVPHVISRTQNLGLTQNFSALNQGFTPSHQTFQSNPLVQREESSFDSSPACLSRQPPLLPLPSPMSEVQHRSPIMECKSVTSCESARKQRFSSHTGPQTSICKKESTTSHCDEVAHFANLDISKEFDFAAMNEQFNKKEIWNEIELNKVEGMIINGNESDGPQTYLNTAPTSCGLSRKAKFVDNFFDPSLSEKEGSGDNRLKGSNISKQSQIDAETFGMSSLPKKRHRLRRGSLSSREQISIQKHHIPTL